MGTAANNSLSTKDKFMTLNQFQVDRIVNSLMEYRKNNFEGTDAQFANMFGLNRAVLSRIKHGDTKNVIRSDKLVSIARKLGVHFSEKAAWNIVETETFVYITEQLKYCQANGEARIMVDLAGIGKTTAAKDYMMKGKNVYYLDCSSYKTRSLFLRAFATAVGVSSNGSLTDIFEDIIFMLQATNKPIVILDEAGDLAYEAFLEIKAFWNRLEGYCGWYMMGADGLRAKIDNNLRSKKVGYAEIFDRFGRKYNSAAPIDPVQQVRYLRSGAEQVVYANLKNKELDRIKEMLNKTLSLRKLKGDIQKLNNTVTDEK